MVTLFVCGTATTILQNNFKEMGAVQVYILGLFPIQ